VISREVTRGGKVARGDVVVGGEGLKEDCILECFTSLILLRLFNGEVLQL